LALSLISPFNLAQLFFCPLFIYLALNLYSAFIYFSPLFYLALIFDLAHYLFLTSGGHSDLPKQPAGELGHRIPPIS